MNTVSKIVNILVLVAAIVAIVLGIMLFNKREDLTKGRENMAQAIVNANEVVLSGNKNGQKIAVDEFKVDKKAADVVAPGAKLKHNIESQKKYRGDASKKFVEIAKIASEGNLTNADKIEKDMADSTTGLAAMQDAQAQIQALVDTNVLVKSTFDKLAAKVNDLGKEFGMEPVKISYEESDLKKLYDRVVEINTKSVPEMKSKNERYAGHVKQVNDVYGQETQSLDTADFESILNDQKALVEKTKKDLEAATAARDEAKNQLAENQKQMEENAKQLEESKAKYDKVMKDLVTAKNKIVELQNIITPPKKVKKQMVTKVVVEGGVEKTIQVEEIVDDEEDNATEEEIQEETAVALSDYLKLQKVQGKVLYVDKSTGFAVIDLGRKIKFEYKNASGKMVQDSVKLPMNGLMTTATSTDPAKARFTGKLQVVKIEEDKAIANVLPVTHNLYPSVGDVVYFTSRDIDAMRGAVMEKAEERTKNAAAKAAPAKQAAQEAAAAEEVADLIGADEDDAAEPATKAPAKKEAPKKEDADSEDADDEVL